MERALWYAHVTCQHGVSRLVCVGGDGKLDLPKKCCPSGKDAPVYGLDAQGVLTQEQPEDE